MTFSILFAAVQREAALGVRRRRRDDRLRGHRLGSHHHRRPAGPAARSALHRRRYWPRPRVDTAVTLMTAGRYLVLRVVSLSVLQSPLMTSWMLCRRRFCSGRPVPRPHGGGDVPVGVAGRNAAGQRQRRRLGARLERAQRRVRPRSGPPRAPHQRVLRAALPPLCPGQGQHLPSLSRLSLLHSPSNGLRSCRLLKVYFTAYFHSLYLLDSRY